MSGPRARSWRVTANHWRHRIWMTDFNINQPLKRGDLVDRQWPIVADF